MTHCLMVVIETSDPKRLHPAFFVTVPVALNFLKNIYLTIYLCLAITETVGLGKFTVKPRNLKK